MLGKAYSRSLVTPSAKSFDVADLGILTRSRHQFQSIHCLAKLLQTKQQKRKEKEKAIIFPPCSRPIMQILESVKVGQETPPPDTTKMAAIRLDRYQTKESAFWYSTPGRCGRIAPFPSGPCGCVLLTDDLIPDLPCTLPVLTLPLSTYPALRSQ
jgi:hypothetical protein